MPADDCLIIPVLSINLWDLIFASVGLFFNIGIKDFEKNINLFNSLNLNNQLNSY